MYRPGLSAHPMTLIIPADADVDMTRVDKTVRRVGIHIRMVAPVVRVGGLATFFFGLGSLVIRGCKG